jgi:hypothetical protein
MSNKYFDLLKDKLIHYEREQPNNEEQDIRVYYGMLLKERQELVALVEEFQTAFTSYKPRMNE